MSSVAVCQGQVPQSLQPATHYHPQLPTTTLDQTLKQLQEEVTDLLSTCRHMTCFLEVAQEISSSNLIKNLTKMGVTVACIRKLVFPGNSYSL